MKKWGVSIGAIALVLVISALPAVTANQEGGFIRYLHGGLGAAAQIDTYYAGGCFEENPLNYYLTVEGRGVLFPGTV